VASLLNGEHGLDVTFVLTVDRESWLSLPQTLQDHSVNLGVVPIAALPPLYERCRLVVFPSLLEAFSVTPLEALVSAKPLVASNRDFVRSSCRGAPSYVDPTNPQEIAEAIALLIRDDEAYRHRVWLGKRIISDHPTARERARAYVDIINSEITGIKNAPLLTRDR
jgi:glycosyltransferase involved in cell wall biosynthesis